MPDFRPRTRFRLPHAQRRRNFRPRTRSRRPHAHRRRNFRPRTGNREPNRPRTDNVRPRTGSSGRLPGRHDALSARQPDLVLPVAPVPGRRPARLAGDRPRPARDGLVGAAGAAAVAGPADRRPRPADRCPGGRRTGRDRGPRLGRTGAAGLGRTPPGPAGRRGPHQHRGRAARRHGTARTDQAGPLRTAAGHRLRADAGVRPGHHRPVPAPAPPTRPRRLRQPVRATGPPERRPGLRGRHPAGVRPPQPCRPGRRGRRPQRPGRSAGAAGLGTPRPRLLDPLPPRPATTAPRRRCTALPAGLAPGGRGRTPGRDRRLGLDRRLRRPAPDARLGPGPGTRGDDHRGPLGPREPLTDRARTGRGPQRPSPQRRPRRPPRRPGRTARSGRVCSTGPATTRPRSPSWDRTPVRRSASPTWSAGSRPSPSGWTAPGCDRASGWHCWSVRASSSRWRSTRAGGSGRPSSSPTPVSDCATSAGPCAAPIPTT